MVNSMWLRAFVAAVLALGAAHAHAQAKIDKGSGKIVCWKDASGKVVGCGDRVPPEYQSAGTKELDKSGTTRKTTESAADIAKRQAREKESAADKAVEEKRLAEQKRQDLLLLNSYTTAAEIDRRRDRDLEPINQQLSQYQAALKTAPDANKAKYEQGIASKEKEKEEIVQKYAAQKQRFQELKGEVPSAAAKPAPATAAAPTPAPAPAPAPAKK
jgi:hypothetical protein